MTAAMEPAPEERDDLDILAGLATGVVPQWSPLRRSGTTVSDIVAEFGVDTPQWSPLRRSGTTREAAPGRKAASTPQWSPLRRSGTTSTAARGCSQPTRRNGARSGGAGRLDTHPSGQTRIYLPQWSPLRRSGTTRGNKCAISSFRCRNGARSGGAGRRLRLPDRPAGPDRRNGARSGGAGRAGLPRVFRTAELVLFHAATCRFRYSSRTSCGVRYPSAEWRRVRLYRSSMYRAISSRAFFRVGYAVRLTSSTFSAALNDSASALSKQIPVRPTDCRIPSLPRTAANSADV